MRVHHFHWENMGYLAEYENGLLGDQLYSLEEVRSYMANASDYIIGVMLYIKFVIIGLILALITKEK